MSNLPYATGADASMSTRLCVSLLPGETPLAFSLRGVARLSALPANLVESFGTAELKQCIRRYLDLISQATDAHDVTSRTLHAIVPVQSDSRLRRSIIAIRRDLFNGSSLSEEQLGAVRMLSCDVQAIISNSDRLNKLIAFERSSASMLYDEALERGRRNLQQCTSENTFSCGLLLASTSLWDSAARYRRAQGTELRSRDQQIEQSLLRYVTRASTKATPFGRFCTIAAVDFVPVEGTARRELYFDSDPGITRGFLRVNKGVYGAFWRILKTDKQSSLHLPIKLNDTARVEESVIRFLAVEGHRETFQRVTVSDELLTVMKELGRTAQPTIKDVAARLLKDAQFETTIDEAEEYLIALIRIGLIHFVEPVPAQTVDWCTTLSDSLRELPTPVATQVGNRSNELCQLADRYRSASAVDRRLLSEQLNELVRAPMDSTSQRKLAAVRNPLFEDYSTSARLCVPLTPEVQSALSSLARWCAIVAPLSVNRSEQETMRFFFAREFQQNGRSEVSLLEFYEAYYRFHVKQNVRAGASNDGEMNRTDTRPVENPYLLSTISARQSSRKALIALIREKLHSAPMAQAINITATELANLIGDNDIQRIDKSSFSVGSFCQLVVSESSKEALLVCRNGAHSTGYGKFVSRFLHTLPDAFSRKIHSENLKLQGDTILAEICNDGNFNANLHPNLLGSGISYPMSEAQANLASISVVDISVVPHPDDPNSVILVETNSRRQIVPVDLGIQVPVGRPALYQLLSKFSQDGFGTVLPDGISNSRRDTRGSSDQNGDVLYRPRILFENRLVLSRRRWSVQARDVPAIATAEDPSAFMLRLNRWRSVNGLPARAFLFVSQRNNTRRSDEAKSPAESVALADTPTESQFKQRRDDSVKPQFVDFESPLLVRLLGRVCRSNLDDIVNFEECLPEPDELPRHHESHFAFEMIVELSKSHI